MMTDDEKAQQLTREINQEQQAKLIYNGVKQYFNIYRAELFDSFGRTNTFAKKKREEIYRQLKSIDTVEAKLLEAIQTGKMAREQLSLMQKAAKKLKI